MVFKVVDGGYIGFLEGFILLKWQSYGPFMTWKIIISIPAESLKGPNACGYLLIDSLELKHYS